VLVAVDAGSVLGLYYHSFVYRDSMKKLLLICVILYSCNTAAMEWFSRQPMPWAETVQTQNGSEFSWVHPNTSDGWLQACSTLISAAEQTNEEDELKRLKDLRSFARKMYTIYVAAGVAAISAIYTSL